MKRVFAIAKLAFFEGIRMRIVLVFIVVLVFLVLRMPFALRGDETLAGRLQNFLAYSLAALSMLLSLATVFFACATLSGELKERSLQLVVTKPVTRFDILLGKWLGVNLLNLLLIVLCGLAIYAFARFIANRPEQFARDRYKVRDVVWTARVAARPTAPDFRKLAADEVDQRIKDGRLRQDQREPALVEQEKELRTSWRTITPGYAMPYEFTGLNLPEREDTVVQVRFKARAEPLPINEQLEIGWGFADVETGRMLGPPIATKERSGDTHQFFVRAGPIIQRGSEGGTGRATLVVFNPYPPDQTRRILFEGDDSLQILYKVSEFELNFGKALLIILLRLALLSSVGIFFSTFVSFPVACLCTFTFYLVALGLPWWLESIGANLTVWDASVDPYGRFGPLVRVWLVPLMRVLFPDFVYYDGARALVDGEYITPGLLGWCALHTVVYGAGLLLGLGWFIFSRKEVAEVIV